MTAAIYARKSTQQDVADEQKSVTRQIDHARAFAARKGWTVLEEHVYVDDGISGAEFTTRPGFLRLMNALKPRAPFAALIMSEISRLGREQIETAYALKQLAVAGVRCFSYLDDREVLMESATDKFLLSAVTFAADLEREKARQRVYDAMRRKALAGQVTGGRVFGYDNVDVVDAAGRRSHVERRINPEEAAVVVRIFDLRAGGVGQARIAKQLNADRVPAPRSQQGRPRAWAPSSVHAVLFRDLYRGVIAWNRSRKRNTWGAKERSERPTEDWITVAAPALRVVTDEQWQAAHGRIAVARADYAADTRGQRSGRPRRRDMDSKYLLPGFARCALCRGGLHVRSRSHGAKRAFFYACTSHYSRGPEVCPHVELWPMDAINEEVLAAIAGDVLRPDLVDEVVTKARELFDQSAQGAHRAALQRELAEVEHTQVRLADAIARVGGNLPVLAARLRTAENRRVELASELEATASAAPPDWRAVDARMRQLLADWRRRFAGTLLDARQGLRELLSGPIQFTPFVERGRRGIRFEGRVDEAVLMGSVVTRVASPTGFEPVFWP